MIQKIFFKSKVPFYLLHCHLHSRFLLSDTPGANDDSGNDAITLLLHKDKPSTNNVPHSTSPQKPRCQRVFRWEEIHLVLTPSGCRVEKWHLWRVTHCFVLVVPLGCRLWCVKQSVEKLFNFDFSFKMDVISSSHITPNMACYFFLLNHIHCIISHIIILYQSLLWRIVLLYSFLHPFLWS